ncbi:XK-related protein 4 [Pipra filicauda]|uniref:XK-related protein n=2 Tax=Pipridae TaxID=114313 RepID=A0A6J0IIL9_9PASS|nr:PREDICTED: XK-related protein 4 [Lepidothrix coronata]XP_027604824.1 XK-related protein 4 [Pipra filicauda]XP_051627814.1 XK-related protein 4 [Manacus candei]
MAAKSDGRRKMKKGGEVAFTPLQNSEHSGSVQALAPGLPTGSGPGGGSDDDEAPGGGCCSSGGSRDGSGGGSRCCCCCGGGRGGDGGGGGGGGSRGSGGGSSSLCLRLGREQRRYSLWDCLWILAALAVYFADVGTDIWLAVDYYLRGQRWWFGLTLFFVLLGSLSVQVFSFRWFAHDFSTEDSAAAAAAAGHCPAAESKLLVSSSSAAADIDAARPSTPQRQASTASKGNATNSSSNSSSNAAGSGAAGPRASGGRSASCAFCIWLLQSLVHILQLGQVWRYFHTMYLGIRSRQSGENDRWRFYWKMVYEYADVSMLHLLATFLESAPQLVLQLCIVVQTRTLQALQGLTAAASLVSLAWALASYQKALRDSRDDKKPISYMAVIIQFCWHFFTIAARVITFALFASVFQLYFGIFIVLHWCIMTFWIVHCETEFCITKWEEIVFDMVVGIIYIFSWFNVKEGRTRCRLFIYYFVILLENTALSVLWYLYKAPQISDAFAIPALCVVFSSFLTGIVFMLMYYAFFHPNGPRFGQSPSCACEDPATAFTLPPEVATSTLRSISNNRSVTSERDQKFAERDGCVPVFQVRPTAPSTPSSRPPRIEESVIKIDLFRNRYPAWERHVLDRSLRKAILAFECSPAPPRLQYKDDALIQERLEYETTL